MAPFAIECSYEIMPKYFILLANIPFDFGILEMYTYFLKIKKENGLREAKPCVASTSQNTIVLHVISRVRIRKTLQSRNRMAQFCK